MSKVLVTESSLESIADAIRSKNGLQTTYKPSQMADAIMLLPTTSTLISKSIEANGSYDPATDNADGYSAVTVNVPNSYAAGDEGKVVSNGVLVAQTARASEITANGTYDTTNNNSVTVNVSGGGGGGLDLNYDFTQSMTDTIRNVPIISSNVTQTANGAVYDTASGSYMQLPRRYCANTYTYEVDVGTIEIRSNYHNRVITWNDSRGLIYRSTGKWAFYTGTWQETDITDPTYLNGCTLKVYIDESGYWHIYRNGALWFEPTSACSINDYGSSTVLIRIGSSGNSMGQGTTITGLRVY